MLHGYLSSRAEAVAAFKQRAMMYCDTFIWVARQSCLHVGHWRVWYMQAGTGVCVCVQAPARGLQQEQVLERVALIAFEYLTLYRQLPPCGLLRPMDASGLRTVTWQHWIAAVSYWIAALPMWACC